MHISMHVDNDVTSGESNNPSDLVTRSFFGFQVSLRVFRGFDGLSSISGSKVMAKLPDFNLGDPLKLLKLVLNDLVSFGPYLGTRNARKSI